MEATSNIVRRASSPYGFGLGPRFQSFSLIKFSTLDAFVSHRPHSAQSNNARHGQTFTRAALSAGQ